jgi:hypothetical protein
MMATVWAALVWSYVLDSDSEKLSKVDKINLQLGCDITDFGWIRLGYFFIYFDLDELISS